MSTQTRAQAAVIGGGPVGLATALLLARLGIETAAIFPATSPMDRRTAALFAGSIELLRNLRVWDHCVALSAPILGIRIIDATGALLRAPETIFAASELQREQFGYNVPNAALVSALLEAAHREPKLQIINDTAAAISPAEPDITLELQQGRQIKADLVIGADGRHSLARSAAQIATETWAYPQTAVVTTFTHQRSHHGISTEFHRPSGPLTTVPMPGKRSSLVWVERNEEADHLKTLPDAEFLTILERHLGGLLGGLETCTPRGAFPLSGLRATTLAAHRVALVGEAAHVMPPIGAQGLNLGLRDAAVLAEILSGATDMGSTAVLQSYATARAADVRTRVAAIDALNRSLLTEFLPAHHLRGLALFALGALPALKRMIVSEGLQPAAATPFPMRPGGLESASSKPISSSSA